MGGDPYGIDPYGIGDAVFCDAKPGSERSAKVATALSHVFDPFFLPKKGVMKDI
jgi:hypothetical protein